VTLSLSERLSVLAKKVSDVGSNSLRNEGDRENNKWTIEMGGH
jgi:hypothetical protein